MVEDAQWLDEPSLRVVVGVAERAGDRGLRLVVTHRPVTGDADLAALDAVLGRSQPLVSLGVLDEPEVAETCAILLGSAVDERLVDAVHEQTQGMADLVDALVTAWAADGTIERGRLAVVARRSRRRLSSPRCDPGSTSWRRPRARCSRR